nr:IS3 family transposase [Legionella quinlivanii]
MKEQEKAYSIKLLCKMMQVSRSAYYRWYSKGHHPKPQDTMLEAKLKALFGDSKNTYGSRRLAKELTAQGFPVGRYKVRRIMEKLRLTVRYPKRFKQTTDSRHGFELAPNLLNRQFKVTAPNQAWTTDISYVWTLEGWMYIAVVMDLYSRQIIGWAVDVHMRTSLSSKALRMAFWRKKPSPGLLHHSDRGSQYASYEYRELLKLMNMQQSMSRKGNCWDNSPTERFFRSIKYESLNYHRFATKACAKLAVIDYLAFYNGRRLHSTLGYKTPLAFEQEFYQRIA